MGKAPEWENKTESIKMSQSTKSTPQHDGRDRTRGSCDRSLKTLSARVSFSG